MPTIPEADAKIANAPGTYALILRCKCAREQAIGHLGTLRFERGFYLYIGSAFGPGGLRARIGRHLRNVKRLHWHIDYALQVLQPVEIWTTCDPRRREHSWAGALTTDDGACTPVRGFGCSDCACTAHLFAFTALPTRHWFAATMAAAGQASSFHFMQAG